MINRISKIDAVRALYGRDSYAKCDGNGVVVWKDGHETTDAEATAITTMTHSGYTGFQISSWRPHCNILVFTSNKRILSQLNLLWGVKSFFYDKFESTDNTIEEVNSIAKKEGYIKKGDMLINLASMPISNKGMVNTMRISQL